MSNTKTVMSQAANTLVTPPVNVEDVFSTYLYRGNGSTQTITNGIDLDGEGGIVWNKSRSDTGDHNLFFQNGSNIDLVKPNKTDSASLNMGQYGVSFNADGFSMAGLFAPSGVDMASWTFRKAPKFFDVVTYTGTGDLGQTISHNLGCDVGMIVVKRTDANGYGWWVYHRGQDGKWANLNSTDAFSATSAQFYFGDDSTTVAPTSTEFTVGSAPVVNANGGSFVAYLFAHNDGDGEFGTDGDADIIKCGSYTGNGSTDGPEIDLGFEPQWVLVKKSENAGGFDGSWSIIDNMRGFTSGGDDKILNPNSSQAELTETVFSPLANGFKVNSSAGTFNGSGAEFIYIAIRRGTKVPESGTEVFDVVTASTSGDYTAETGFVNDFLFYRTQGEISWSVWDRLRGNPSLEFNSTGAEFASIGKWDSNTSFYLDGLAGDFSNYYNWAFKRAPNFFDVVAYTGNGTAGRTVSHNLGVAPEMIWVKSRNQGSYPWKVYHTTVGAGASLELNSTAVPDTNTVYWNDTAPTESAFSLGTAGNTNGNTETFIAYLFASLDGISKVGSYTGNGTSQTIDCGFTSGARFVLIKRTTSVAESWYVFDSVRGITSAATDPLLMLNNTIAEQTESGWFGHNVIEPNSTGFSLASSTQLNVSGDTYIFYATA